MDGVCWYIQVVCIWKQKPTIIVTQARHLPWVEPCNTLTYKGPVLDLGATPCWLHGIVDQLWLESKSWWHYVIIGTGWFHEQFFSQNLNLIKKLILLSFCSHLSDHYIILYMHAMTAWLLCHLPNFVAITMLDFGKESKRKLLSNLKAVQ